MSACRRGHLFAPGRQNMVSKRGGQERKAKGRRVERSREQGRRPPGTARRSLVHPIGTPPCPSLLSAPFHLPPSCFSHFHCLSLACPLASQAGKGGPNGPSNRSGRHPAVGTPLCTRRRGKGKRGARRGKRRRLEGGGGEMRGEKGRDEGREGERAWGRRSDRSRDA